MSVINGTLNININYMTKIIIYFCIYCLVLLSFLINTDMIMYKHYRERLIKITINSILLYCCILALISLIIFLFLKSNIKIDISKKHLLIYISLYYVFIVWICLMYFSFCIRLLNSINVKCSIFITISVKSMLIALVAWVSIYRHTQATIDYYINLLVSIFGLLYPILDMYKYVRSKIDEFDKQEQQEKEKCEELEKEKYKYDLYNYD